MTNCEGRISWCGRPGGTNQPRKVVVDSTSRSEFGASSYASPVCATRWARSPRTTVRLPQECNRHGTQRAVAGPGGERVHGNGFDMPVEGRVIGREELVVVEVARTGGAQERHDESTPRSPHAAGRLNVAGARLGLAL